MKDTFKSGEEFGENIRKVRERKGFTLKELGAKSELSQSYLSDVERGNVKSPGIDVIKRIAEALEVSIDELADTELPQEKDNGNQDSSTLNYHSAGISSKMIDEALDYPCVKVVIRTFADSEISEETKQKLDNIIGNMFNLALYS